MASFDMKEMQNLLEYSFSKLQDFGTLSCLVCGMLLSKNLADPDKAISKIMEMQQLSDNIALPPDKQIIMHSTQTLKSFTQENESIKMLLATKFENYIKMNQTASFPYESTENNDLKKKRTQKEIGKNQPDLIQAQVLVKSEHPPFDNYKRKDREFVHGFTRQIDRTTNKCRLVAPGCTLNSSFPGSDPGCYFDGKVNVSKQNINACYKNPKKSNGLSYKKTEPVEKVMIDKYLSSNEGTIEASVKPIVTKRPKRKTTEKKRKGKSSKNMCALCNRKKKGNKPAKSSNCKHRFHIECLKECFEHKFGRKKTSLECPLDGCHKRLDIKNLELEVKKLGNNDQEEFSKLFSFTYQNQEISVQTDPPNLDLPDFPESNTCKNKKSGKLASKVEEMLKELPMNAKPSRGSSQNSPTYSNFPKRGCYTCSYKDQDQEICTRSECKCKRSKITKQKRPGQRNSDKFSIILDTKALKGLKN
ncbi:unnamed protein product [Moneuplotes crassus]|uniref:RING-type domain-containing protein n=1 Tax=Euplotes crassus TaxID=5936 RepID=A0AAD1UKC9_EUPCR|nr:unnamed protein product [Moneuplotes crassus]